MSEGRIDHEFLELEWIDDPLPRSSFGTIGRFVAVRWPEDAALFSRVSLEVPYSDEALGLPGLQLPPVPSKWVPKDFPRPRFRKRRSGPFIYALLTDNVGPWSAGPAPPATAAVEIVDTRTWARAAYFSLGSVGYVVSLE